MESDVTCECLSDKSKLQGKENNQVQRDIQFSSVAQSCLTLCNPMDRGTPGLPVHHQLLEFTQTRAHWVGDAIQPSYPLSSPSPPTLNPSQHQGLFKWVSSSHQVAKVLSFSFSINPSDEYSGLISFRMDWLDLLAVQGTLHNDKKVNPPKRHRNPKWYAPDNRTAKYLKQKLKGDTDNSTIIVGNLNSTLSTNRTWRKSARA